MFGKFYRVFLNDNIIYRNAQRGVTRYFKAITDDIIAHFGTDTIICSPEFRNYGPAKHIPSIRSQRYHKYTHDLIAQITAYLKQPAILYSAYYGNIQTRAAEVFAVYDMIHELFPQYFSPDERTKFIAEKKQCIERAAALFAISKSTARDIVAFYPKLDATKIVVTPLGVSDFFFETDDQQSSKSEKPFFLYVGHRGFYKNFLRLLIAFGESDLAQTFDLRVISPSDNDFTLQEAEYIAKYCLEGKVKLMKGVDNHKLRANYMNSIALIYPSEYEGFGLPILEAMAAGTLVTTSNVSSMPEVGGDVAFYFDPYNTESIADCLRQIIDLSVQQRQKRITQGIIRAKTFTWARCQQQTVEVLQGLLDNDVGNTLGNTW